MFGQRHFLIFAFTASANVVLVGGLAALGLIIIVVTIIGVVFFVRSVINCSRTEANKIAYYHTFKSMAILGQLSCFEEGSCDCCHYYQFDCIKSEHIRNVNAKQKYSSSLQCICTCYFVKKTRRIVSHIYYPKPVF